MRLLDSIAELIAPTRCAGCEIPGALICDACDEALPRIDRQRACPRCAAPFGRLVCTECWSTEHAFAAAVALGELDGALARAVVLYKDAGERRLGALMGGLLAERVASAWPGWADIVTWVPPTRVALRRRGFDHGRGLAVPVAQTLGLPPGALLNRARAADQRTLGRSARAANVAGTFEASAPPPRRVLVIDDVLTTGATLDAAAVALLEAGAQETRCAVVARAW